MHKDSYFGNDCKHQIPSQLGYACTEGRNLKSCFPEDCPLLLDKLKQIKKMSFTKELRYVAKCPICHSKIKERICPEINSFVYCSKCNNLFEICSMNNYIDELNQSPLRRASKQI